MVGGQDVLPVVDDESRGDTAQDVQHLVELLPHPMGRGGPAAGRALGARAGDLEEVVAFHVVQVQGAGHAVQDALGDVGVAALFQAGVVVGVHSPARRATSSRRRPGTLRAPPLGATPAASGLRRARREGRKAPSSAF